MNGSLRKGVKQIYSIFVFLMSFLSVIAESTCVLKFVGNNMETIAKIVLDHLAEDPEYYDKLEEAKL